MDFIIIVVMN